MKLADIIETFISGDWGEEKVAEDTPNSVFCIRGADIVPITYHCFNGIPQRFVCDKTIENKTLKAGDLIIEKSGGSPTQSTGRIIYVSEDMIKAIGNVVCSNFCTAFRVKAGWNPLYVYYFWQNVYNHGAFFNFEGKTSGIKNLQLDNALSAIDIEYLPLEKQNRIVASLASIDEKIKVNRQINDNLEAMAKQLYDYWFVQFDFPNEEGKPYKSSGGAMVWNEKLKREIPQGWDIQNLADCLKLKTERVNSKDIKYTDNYTPIEVIPRKQMSLHETVALENAMSGICRYRRRNILLSNRRVYFHKVCIAPFDGLTRDTVMVLEPYEEDNLGYLYETVFNDKFILYATKHSYGSEQPVFSWTAAQKYIVLKPSSSIDKKYSKIIDSIIESVLNHQMEIIKMTKQRDELLPLLMNGQASINYHLSDD